MSVAAASPPAVDPPASPYPPYPPEMEADEFNACTGLELSAEEFLRLPPNPALDRWLIDGVLWEQPMTVRSLPHTEAEIHVAHALVGWLKSQPEPRPRAGSGEVGVRFPGRNSVVGIDAAVFDAETAARQPPPPEEGEGMHVWHGVPLLAVEINSPTDRERDITAKVREYLAAGVAQVWVLSPGLQSVTVHRPTGRLAIYSGDDTLHGDPELPGFAVRAGDLFGG
ncbi:Uma2 family endonuclease [Alienimonas sp. DA493]|uniref:Uma2 family endonuclease n=1 Tax=Alienimonas sp. DA493 TaxID=3373605 RepID=UPI0037548A23